MSIELNPLNPQQLFGAAVRESRHLLGISQEELASRSALHRTYISDLERGERNPSLTTMLRLAEALKVPIPVLIPGKPQPGKASQSKDKPN